MAEVSRQDLLTLAGSRILVLGATGFIGTWVCQSLAHAAHVHALPLEITVVSRSPRTSASMLRSIAPRIEVNDIAADVTEPLPSIGHHDIVFHAATSASAALNESDPFLMRNTIVAGMRNLLDLATSWGSTKIVFTSSGAVYGKQPEQLAQVPESFVPADSDVLDAYSEGKREAERMLQEWIDGSRHSVSARLFAFLGPGLPLDTHFAAGNFLRDAIKGGPIVIHGDGRTIRSYQYPTDMCSWMFALAARNVAEFAYNVGSADEVSLADLASRIARAQAGNPQVDIRGEPRPIHRYVPSTTRIETELGVENLIDLDEGIARTLRWASR